MVAKSIIGLFGNKIAPVKMHTSDDKSPQQALMKSKTYRSNGASQNQLKLGDDEQQRLKLDDAKNTIGYYNVARNQISSTIEDQIQYLYPEQADEFTWDPEASSKEISFSADYRHAFLYETNYYFRTITSNRPFFNGIHYWEIVADARTEHELKIGVTA